MLKAHCSKRLQVVIVVVDRDGCKYLASSRLAAKYYDTYERLIVLGFFESLKSSFRYHVCIDLIASCNSSPML